MVGDGLAEAVTLGPLHTAAGRDRVARMVADAEAHGASVRTAGRIREADTHSGGYFVLPTVVTDLAADTALATEEQFGPVLPILSYTDVNDAIARANDSEYGLGGTVWTKDLDRGYEVASQVLSGTIWVNKHLDLPFDVPFGGAKQSGIGAEYGQEGLEEFTQAKTVNIAKQAW